ncbi:twin-arginine translocase TatA/TatE family subunit [Novosphingobium sp. TH158]|uniref:twin-arginine translocase TatA/TatE family subunit n=1 Tax=Novosphingobium sp. TH158 TaxID=2067455 RepID=UPI000C7E7C4D|nr:twin-arginine translocase TatA/TatE family subunit [Novosphingobium sp. TH158]PLK25499.1 twin-arginine translocase TatA/TatE family subunit [Novosphingobium sp. TH158]
MGAWGIGHWIVVLVVVLVLFGRGRVADVMGEFGKGLKSFKQGMADEDNKPVPPPPAQIPAPDAAPAASASEKTKTGE